MKKVLTILVVLALVCGAVFTDETEKHTIKLKTNVGGLAPAFQLEYKEGTNVAASQSALTNEGTDPAVYDAAVAHSYDQTVDEITVLDISKYAISVTFQAQIANEAKQVEDYQITFKADPFAAKKDGDDYNVVAESFSAAIIDGMTSARKGIVANTAYSTAVPTEADQDGVWSQSLGLHFNGTTCVPGVFAEVTVAYPKDETVDPHADATEFYTANIWMEVTAK